jgi:ribosome-binding factor A
LENKRLKKLSRLLQKDLSDILQRDCQHLFPGVFITVSQVFVTADLGIARVYLSFMLAPKPQEVLATIEEHSAQIRLLLGQKIRNQVRKIPNLVFYLDDTYEVMQEVEKLFDHIHVPPAPTQED